MGWCIVFCLLEIYIITSIIDNVLSSVSAKSSCWFLLGFVPSEIPLQESTWHRAHWSVPTHFKISLTTCITCASEIRFGFNKDLSVTSHVVAVILRDPPGCRSKMLDGFLPLVYHSVPMQAHMMQTDQSVGHTYKQLTSIKIASWTKVFFPQIS